VVDSVVLSVVGISVVVLFGVGYFFEE